MLYIHMYIQYQGGSKENDGITRAQGSKSRGPEGGRDVLGVVTYRRHFFYGKGGE